GSLLSGGPSAGLHQPGDAAAAVSSLDRVYARTLERLFGGHRGLTSPARLAEDSGWEAWDADPWTEDRALRFAHARLKAPERVRVALTATPNAGVPDGFDAVCSKWNSQESVRAQASGGRQSPVPSSVMGRE
ncbi:MAG: hypothetical protein AAF907_16395, partial [Planctomycetota bacterium]